jgi:mannose-6-phosphate isomerase-like protein (cupin superfamily)
MIVDPTTLRAMSDYKHVNLKELDDLAAERPEDIEARFGRGAIESEHLGVTYFRMGPDFRSPFGHRHREQEEAYVVVSGSGSIRLNDEVRDLRRWDVVRVAPRVTRAFSAGPDGMELIAIGNDRPEGGDGEMIPDFWGE